MLELLVAARDAVANRIEILKQATYAKEPFHVQLVKVQAALARAEEVAEKKHSAVWTAKEAADTRGPARAEPPATHGRAHGEASTRTRTQA